MPLWQAIIATVVGMGVIIVPLLWIVCSGPPPRHDRNRDLCWPEPGVTNCVVHPDYATHTNVPRPDGAEPLQIAQPPATTESMDSWFFPPPLQKGFVVEDAETVYRRTMGLPARENC